MKFAMFEAGLPVAFYDPDINDVPPGAVEITEEVWAEFLAYPEARKWDGEKIVECEPPSAPSAPPAPLTARQLRLGLVYNGFILDQVETAIAGIDDAQARAVAKIEWEYASQFNREHPLITQVGVALGLDDAAIDLMWAAALKL